MDLHWTFLLVPPAILYFSYQPGYGLVVDSLTWWSAITVMLFTFVLIHELGHALVAKSRKVTAEKIILFPLGGGAYLPDRPRTVLDEVMIYGAGPAANLLLMVAALPILLANPDGELILRRFVDPTGNYVIQPNRINDLLGVTVAVNFLLAFGNLLPAYPLDGGRILRALLRGPVGERSATVVVTVLGVIIGTGLAYLGYQINDPLLGMGALFIIGTSVTTFRSGWQRRRLAEFQIERVLRKPTIGLLRQPLYPRDDSRKAQQLFQASGWPVLPVFDEWNELRGFISKEVLDDEDPTAQHTLRQFVELEFVSAKPGENLLTVTERIVAANVYGAAVYDEHRNLIGYVFTEDIMRVLGK